MNYKQGQGTNGLTPSELEEARKDPEAFLHKYNKQEVDLDRFAKAVIGITIATQATFVAIFAYNQRRIANAKIASIVQKSIKHTIVIPSSMYSG